MPLKKGKEAFSANVAKERAAGKPLKQALAIAYDVKRRYSEGHKGTKAGHRKGDY